MSGLVFSFLSYSGHDGGDLVRGDDGGHGEAVPDALGHGDDVGDDVVALEAPEVLPGPPEPSLNLKWGQLKTFAISNQIQN